MTDEKTTTPEVSTTPTAEELLKLIASLSGGKSIEAIRLQVAATEKAEQQKAAAVALKAQVAEKLAPAIKAAHGIKVPLGIETAKISVSKDQTTGLFTFNLNRATTWYNQKVNGLNDRELKIIGESVGKDKKIVDFVKSLYEEVYDAAIEKSAFDLNIFKPLTDECAKTVMTTSTPIQVEFNFKWKEIQLPDEAKQVVPEWAITSNLDKKDASTPKAPKNDNGEKKEPEKTDKAPGKIVWYDYLQKRLAAGDVELKAWFDVPNSHTQSAQVYYFRLHLDKTVPGTFYNWIRKDDPAWKSVKEA